ncbi:unnamed protein product, partial [Durusdinium trenchii]
MWFEARFEAAGQEQVFRFIDGKLCSETEAKSLVTQLADLDLEYVANSLRSAQAEVAAIAEAQDLEPPDDFMCLALSTKCFILLAGGCLCFGRWTGDAAWL